MTSPNKKQPRISTVSTPSPTGGRQIVSSQQKQTIPRSVITPETVKDPVTLAKTIQDMVEATNRGTEAARTNPFGAVFIQAKQPYTVGKQINIKHNLGVPWKYVKIVHSEAGSYPVSMVRANKNNVPSGLDDTTNASIVPTARPNNPIAITGATNASPVVITATGHGFVTGDMVFITGVTGNTAANGTWSIINVLSANTFSISVAGNGAYVSGGTVVGAGIADIEITG